MIKTAQLINFESHTNSFFRFDKGVSSLSGETDAGKSSVVRAIKWVCSNRPLGDDYRTYDSIETKVVLGLDDGYYITKIRSDVINCYEISKGNKVVDVLKASMGSVPEPVAKLLNVSDINFQGQHDPAFLFSKSSGDVATTLNNAVSLDLINSSLSKVKKLLNDTNSELKHNKKDVTQLQDKLPVYDHIDEMERVVSRLESKERRKTDIRRKQEILAKHIDEYKKQHARIVYTERISLLQPVLSLLNRKYKDSCDTLVFYSTLGAIIREIKQTQILLRKNIKILKGREQIKILLEKVQRVQKLKKESKNLKQSVEQITEIETKLAQYKKTIARCRKQMPKKCPTCGKRLRENERGNIKKKT